MSMPGTFPTISEESYAAEMAMREESAARERHLREQAVLAETDPGLQCHHGISLYRDCAPCCVEVGDPLP